MSFISPEKMEYDNSVFDRHHGPIEFYQKVQKLPLNIKTLLEDIQDWMMSNDYECGPVGSTIWSRISEILGEEND